MVRVWVEVNDVSRDRFRVEAQAETIERAVQVVLASYPGCHCQVRFPIDPENFFSGGQSPMVAIREERELGGELFTTMQAST